MTTIALALAQTTESLVATGNLEACFEGEVLVMHALGLSRAQLYSRWTEPLDGSRTAFLQKQVARRQQGEPLAYILGHREFYGLDLAVDRRVLIPRPETELLVEAALGWISNHQQRPSLVADIGTGSGAIAVSLAHMRPDIAIYATDRSPEALTLARENVARHGLADRVTLLEGDLVAPLPEPVDLLVANLPYVKETDLPAWCGSAQVELAWEPNIALDGGPDGLDIIGRFLDQAPEHLHYDGAVFLEIGWDQGEETVRLARAAFPSARISLHKDFAGLDRIVAIQCG